MPKAAPITAKILNFLGEYSNETFTGDNNATRVTRECFESSEIHGIHG